MEASYPFQSNPLSYKYDEYLITIETPIVYPLQNQSHIKKKKQEVMKLLDIIYNIQNQWPRQYQYLQILR